MVQLLDRISEKWVAVILAALGATFGITHMSTPSMSLSGAFVRPLLLAGVPLRSQLMGLADADAEMFAAAAAVLDLLRQQAYSGLTDPLEEP